MKNLTQTLDQSNIPTVDSKYIPESPKSIKDLEIGECCFISNMAIWLDEDNKLWVDPNFNIQESGGRLKLTKKIEGYSLFILKNYTSKFFRCCWSYVEYEPIIEIEYEQNDK